MVSEEVGLKLDEVDSSVLGHVDSITSDKEYTTIVANKADPAELESRIKEIRGMIQESDSDYDKEKMQERLARLAGGVAVIRV